MADMMSDIGRAQKTIKSSINMISNKSKYFEEMSSLYRFELVKPATSPIQKNVLGRRKTGKNVLPLSQRDIIKSGKLLQNRYIEIDNRIYYVMNYNALYDVRSSEVVDSKTALGFVRNVEDIKVLPDTDYRIESAKQIVRRELGSVKTLGRSLEEISRERQGKNKSRSAIVDIETSTMGVRNAKDILTVGVLKRPEDIGQVEVAKEFIKLSTLRDIRNVQLQNKNVASYLDHLMTNEAVLGYLKDRYGDVTDVNLDIVRDMVDPDTLAKINRLQSYNLSELQKFTVDRSKAIGEAIKESIGSYINKGFDITDSSVQNRLWNEVKFKLKDDFRLDSITDSTVGFLDQSKVLSEISEYVKAHPEVSKMDPKSFARMTDIDPLRQIDDVTNEEFFRKAIDNQFKMKYGSLENTQIEYNRVTDTSRRFYDIDEGIYERAKFVELMDRIGKNSTGSINKLDLDLNLTQVLKHHTRKKLKSRFKSKYGFDVIDWNEQDKRWIFTDIAKQNIDTDPAFKNLKKDVTRYLHSSRKEFLEDMGDFGRILFREGPDGEDLLHSSKVNYSLRFVRDDNELSRSLSKELRDTGNVWSFSRFDEQLGRMLGIEKLKRLKDIRALGLSKLDSLFKAVKYKDASRMFIAKANMVANALNMDDTKANKFVESFTNFDVNYMQGTNVESLIRFYGGTEYDKYLEEHLSLADVVDERKLAGMIVDGKIGGQGRSIDNIIKDLQSAEITKRADALGEYSNILNRWIRTNVQSMAMKQFGVDGKSLKQLSKEYGIELDLKKYDLNIADQMRKAQAEFVGKVGQRVDAAFNESKITDRFTKNLSENINPAITRRLQSRYGMTIGNALLSTVLLSVGVSATNRLKTMMFGDKLEEEKRQRAEGLRHDSGYTVLRRINMTDFTSDRRFGLSSTFKQLYNVLTKWGKRRISKFGASTVMKNELSEQFTSKAKDIKNYFSSLWKTSMDNTKDFISGIIKGEKDKVNPYVLGGLGLGISASVGYKLFSGTYGDDEEIPGTDSRGIQSSLLRARERFAGTDFGSPYGGVSKLTDIFKLVRDFLKTTAGRPDTSGTIGRAKKIFKGIGNLLKDGFNDLKKNAINNKGSIRTSTISNTVDDLSKGAEEFKAGGKNSRILDNLKTKSREFFESVKRRRDQLKERWGLVRSTDKELSDSAVSDLAGTKAKFSESRDIVRNQKLSEGKLGKLSNKLKEKKDKFKEWLFPRPDKGVVEGTRESRAAIKGDRVKHESGQLGYRIKKKVKSGVNNYITKIKNNPSEFLLDVGLTGLGTGGAPTPMIGRNIEYRKTMYLPDSPVRDSYTRDASFDMNVYNKIVGSRHNYNLEIPIIRNIGSPFSMKTKYGNRGGMVYESTGITPVDINFGKNISDAWYERPVFVNPDNVAGDIMGQQVNRQLMRAPLTSKAYNVQGNSIYTDSAGIVVPENARVYEGFGIS